MLTIMAATVACSESASENEEAAQPPKQSVSEVLEANDFRTGELKPRPISNSFTVTGRVEAPPQSTAQVFPTVGAFVKEVYVIKGREVQKGDKLAALRHPDITDLQQRYLSARNSLEQNKEDYLRKQQLMEDEAVSTREMQQAKAAYLSAQSEVQGLASTLRSLGVNPESLSGENLQETVYLTAPIGGHILNTRAGVGQFAGTNEPIFTIVSKDHLHLELQVPPSKIDLIKVGHPVKFTTRTSDQLMQGEVYLVNQVADEMGFFNVHAHFSDSLKSLHPGTFAEVKLIYQTDTLPALPLTAIFEDHGQQYAVAVENDKFVEVPVTTGMKSDSLISILNPEKLKGKTVVMNGVKYLKGKAPEEGHGH